MSTSMHGKTKDRITPRVTSKGEKRYDARVRIDGKPVKKTFIRRADADAFDGAGIAVDQLVARERELDAGQIFAAVADVLAGITRRQGERGQQERDE